MPVTQQDERLSNAIKREVEKMHVTRARAGAILLELGIALLLVEGFTVDAITTRVRDFLNERYQ